MHVKASRRIILNPYMAAAAMVLARKCKLMHASPDEQVVPLLSPPPHRPFTGTVVAVTTAWMWEWMDESMLAE